MTSGAPQPVLATRPAARSTDRWWRWIRTVLPPLLLLPLLWLPMDFATALGWLMGGAVALIALIRLLRRDGHFRFRLARLAAVIALLGGGIASQVHAERTARRFTTNTAHQIQQHCARDGRCPRFLAGWAARGDLYVCETRAGALGREFRVMYRVLDEGQAFELRLRLNLDAALFVHGGVDRPVQLSDRAAASAR